ncbi:MAG: TlpA family protein disulfide reductase [Bacteroidia bacterium]
MKSVLFLLSCLFGIFNLFAQTDIPGKEALTDSVDQSQQEQSFYLDVPHFKASLTNGETFDLSDYKGKVVLINFWFTSCESCLNQLSELEAIHQKFANQEISFVTIQLENEEDFERLFRRISKDMPTCQQSMVAQGEQIVKNYGFERFPINMLIDQTGEVQLLGRSKPNQTERKLKKMLKS